MNAKTKADLLRAGEMIAREERITICGCIGSRWQDTPEAEMINPGTFVWWGKVTMVDHSFSHPCRQARLLGIAMMVTMEECGILMEEGGNT